MRPRRSFRRASRRGFCLRAHQNDKCEGRKTYAELKSDLLALLHEFPMGRGSIQRPQSEGCGTQLLSRFSCTMIALAAVGTIYQSAAAALPIKRNAPNIEMPSSSPSLPDVCEGDQNDYRRRYVA